MVSAIDETEPATLPVLSATVRNKFPSDVCTSLLDAISKKDASIDTKFAFMLSKTDMSPKPILKPFVKLFFNATKIFLSFSIFFAALSISLVSTSAFIPVPFPAPDPALFLSFVVSVLSILFNLSKLNKYVWAFFRFAAVFFVLFSVCFDASDALFIASAVLAAEFAVLLSAECFPINASVKFLNAFAATESFAINIFSHFITGVNTLISPCPIVALRLSNCNDNNLTWFAQESDVLAKSPAAFVSCDCTNAYRKDTFSISVISAVVFLYPLANAYASKAL